MPLQVLQHEAALQSSREKCAHLQRQNTRVPERRGLSFNGALASHSCTTQPAASCGCSLFACAMWCPYRHAGICPKAHLF